MKVGSGARIVVGSAGILGLLAVADRLPGAQRSGVRTSTEVRMIVVGMSSIPIADPAAFGDAIRRIRQELAARAQRSGVTFVAIGLAMDESPRAGLNFLERGLLSTGDTVRMGTFDELHVGRAWANAYAVELIWRIRTHFLPCRSSSSRSGRSPASRVAWSYPTVARCCDCTAKRRSWPGRGARCR